MKLRAGDEVLEMSMLDVPRIQLTSARFPN